MKPYARAHDIDNAGLRDYFAWDEPRRHRWPRVLVCLVAVLVFALAFVAFAFAQDGGEAPTGQPASSIGRIYPLTKGTAGTDADGYHTVALKDLATTVHSHACVVGTVAFKAREADGDLHIRLTDDAGYFIVAEVIPRIPIVAPKTGQRVEICGITRIDRFHRTKEYPDGWPELHPVLKIRVLSGDVR
jgi:hypothetical protein